jgi:hypothetical protein
MKPQRNFIPLLLTLILFMACNKPKVEVVKTDKVNLNETSSVIEKFKNQKLTKEQQIASAILAAPVETRAGAKVYGFDNDGKFEVLRAGSNDMICIADDPNKDGFEVVCYHKDLEPYMARGRALKDEGKSFAEKRDIRNEEAREGKLAMPEKSATLHVLYGENGYFDTEDNSVKNAKYRYVVYMPFATQESTGLSLKPNAPGHPWLMFPGKANAHIMITPE